MSNTEHVANMNSADENDPQLDENLTDCSNVSDDNAEDRKLDEEIDESTKQLELLEQPSELDMNQMLNDDFTKSLFENIKSLPRDKAIRLLANLAKTKKLPEHKFTTISEQQKKQSETNLRDKIRELKLRRSSKAVLSNYEEQIKRKLELNHKKVIQDENAEPDESKEELVTLSKSQKKRRKRYLSHKRLLSENSTQSTDENPENSTSGQDV